MTKKHILEIGLFVLVGVIFLGGVMGILLKKNFPLAKNEVASETQVKPQATTQNDEFASWKTYHSEKYGFQIKLPEGWTASIREKDLVYKYGFLKVFDTVELSKKDPNSSMVQVDIDIGCFSGTESGVALGAVESAVSKPVVIDGQTSTYFYDGSHFIYDKLRFFTRIIKQVSPNQSYYDDCGLIIHSSSEDLDESMIVKMVSSITFDKGFAIFTEDLNSIFKTIRPIPSQG